MRTAIATVLVLALLGGAGYLAANYFRPTAVEIPTVEVRRGEFLVKSYARGELRAVKTGLILSPNVRGSLVITQLAAMGSTVEQDEVVLGFDPSEQENNVATHQSQLAEADQEIVKNRADLAIREHTDKVDLLKAEFAVRRAELDVSRNELVSEIDARKNDLALEAARKRLAQLRQDIQSRQKSGAADLAVAQEKRNKALLDAQQAERRLQQLTVRSPMPGLVSVRSNRFASGGFFFPGMDLPEYRVGDQSSGGDSILDVVDTADMEVSGKISEVERGNLREGQDVQIRLDAVPEMRLPGKVKTVASMTSRGMFTTDPTKTFDAVFALTQQDKRLRPGMSGEVEIITERLKDVVYVPLQAVFEKEGKKWVYVRDNGKFHRREVTTGSRSESQVQIAKGLSGHEHIALLDPEAKRTTEKGGKAAGPGLPASRPGR